MSASRKNGNFLKICYYYLFWKSLKKPSIFEEKKSYVLYKFSMIGYMGQWSIVINSGKRIKLIMFTTLALLSKNKHALYHGIRTLEFIWWNHNYYPIIFPLRLFLCCVYFTFTCWNSRNVKDFHCCVLDWLKCYLSCHCGL